MLAACATGFAQVAERPAETWAELNAQAQQAYRDAQYQRGVDLGAEALAFAEKRFGSQDTRTIMSANTLALNYDALGQLDAAEPLFVRALHAHERAYGPDHPLTLISLTNLAGLYQLRGRFDEAEAMLRRVIDARVRQFGENSADTARAQHNLQLLQHARASAPRPEPIASGQAPALDQTAALALASIDLSAIAQAPEEVGQPIGARPWGLRSLLPMTRPAFAREHGIGIAPSFAGPSRAQTASPAGNVPTSKPVDAPIQQTTLPVLPFDMTALSFGENDWMASGPDPR